MLLKERMFRIKPYTKCLDCVRTDKIRCKQCMDRLIETAAQQKKPHEPEAYLRKSPKYKKLLNSKYPVRVASSFFNRTKEQSSMSFSQKSSQFSHVSHGQMKGRATQRSTFRPEYQIQSKYEDWMNHVVTKRSENKENIMGTTYNQWPIKKRALLSEEMTRDHSKQKLGRWEAKFMNRIKSIDVKESLIKGRETRQNICPMLH